MLPRRSAAADGAGALPGPLSFLSWIRGWVVVGVFVVLGLKCSATFYFKLLSAKNDKSLKMFLKELQIIGSCPFISPTHS